MLGHRNLQRACNIYIRIRYIKKILLIELYQDGLDAILLFSQSRVSLFTAPVVSPNAFSMNFIVTLIYTVFIYSKSREVPSIEFSNTYPLSNPAPSLVKV